MSEFYNDQWRLPNNENKDKVSNFSMDFDGTSGIQFADISQLNSATKLSFNIWVNYENMTQRIIFSKEGSTSSIRLYNWTSGVLYFWLKNSGTGTVSYVSNFSSLVNLNEWNMLTVVYDGTQTSNNDRVKIFLNGGSSNILTNYGTIPTSTGNITDSFAIGEYSSGAGNKFLGQIDAVSIYNYALSASQVTTLYGSSSTGIGNPMSLSPKPVFYAPLGDQDSFNGANYLVPNASLKDYVFDFNGTSSKIVTTEENLGTTNSISFWHKRPTGLGSNKVVIGGNTLNRFDGTIILNSFQLAIGFPTDKALYFTDNIFSAGVNASGVNIPYEDVWVHYCITRNGTTQSDIKLYVNSYLVTSSKAEYFGAVDYTTNTTILNLGAASAQSNFSEGELSNISTFSSAFTQAQVNTLYNNGTPSDISSLNPNNWWKLDASDTFDGTNWTIEDHAGSNDGISSGMSQSALQQSDLSFTSGYSPFALDFDSASGDYIDCNSFTALNSGTAMTVSLWFKGSTYITNARLIRCAQFEIYQSNAAYSNTQGRLSYKPRKSYGNPIVTLGGSSGLGVGKMVDGQWHHICLTFDNSTTTTIAYEDGISVTSNTTTGGTLNPTATNLWVSSGGATLYNSGSISNVSVWNAALTSAQVTELYSEGIPQNLNNHSAVSSLISWWQLGSNSSFNSSLNQWTCIDEKGTNTGESSQTFDEDAIVDGVGSYANGVGTSGLEVIGSAPFSNANSLSINMDVLDRVEDTPS